MRGRTAKTGARRREGGSWETRGGSWEMRGWELGDSGVGEKYYREKIDTICWKMGERGWEMGESTPLSTPSYTYIGRLSFLNKCKSCLDQQK